jgi:GT2 family glycosyltransferase
MTSRVSVVIPTYKRIESLRRLLDALRHQPGRPAIEVIVVDQNPPGYLSGLDMESQGVKRVAQTEPNASSARNLGALHSRGAYIVFLDDDVIPAPDFCERAMQFMDAHPQVACLAPFVQESAQAHADRLADVRRKIVAQEDRDLFHITDTVSAAVIFRREAFFRSGGFDPLLFRFARTAEDQEFFLRFAYRDLKLHFTPALTIRHDQDQAGGCELRTSDYWTTREKCIRSWVYRYRIHRRGLRLTAGSLWRLARSAFLNRAALMSGPSSVRRQIALLRRAIDDTATFLAEHGSTYGDIATVDHLGRLRAGVESPVGR